MIRRASSTWVVRSGAAIATVFLAMMPLAALATNPGTLESATYELDNINFASSLALSATQDGVAPSISGEGPTVIDLEPTKVTITWKTDKASSSSIDYGKTADYGQESGSADYVTEHSITLYGLTPETVYHYRATSIDPLNLRGRSPDKTFTTPAQSGINSIKIGDVGYDTALVSWQTGDFTVSHVEYGTSLAYGSVTTTLSRSYTTDHTVQLTSLKSGTSYHVRIVAENEKGGSTKSSDFSFTTLAEPVFGSIQTFSNDPNHVLVVWKTNTLTSGTLLLTHEGDNVQQAIGSEQRLMEHRTVISGLLGNSTYSFVITASDEHGHQVVSDKNSFTTPVDTTPPVITGLKTSVTRSGDNLVLNASWTTDEPATSEATLTEKGKGTSVALTPQTGYNLDHVLIKSGLTPSTPYSLKIVSKDPAGNTSQQEISFVSASLHKSILTLLLDSILASFGWLGRAFGK